MDLPLINSCLNFISATLLVLGYKAVKNKNVELHKKFMISAFCTSALFFGFLSLLSTSQWSFTFQRRGTCKNGLFYHSGSTYFISYGYVAYDNYDLFLRT